MTRLTQTAEAAKTNKKESKPVQTQMSSEEAESYIAELEARRIMAKEWNDFKVPEPIDEFITQALYWEEKKKHQVILSIMENFDTIECYASKCVWFSTQNYHHRKEEEARGAYYQSSFCTAYCTPRQFRSDTSST